MPLIKKQRRLGLGGLMSGLGEGINQVLPPLAMNYIAVKKAETPDFAAVKQKTQQESEESATELEKELNKQFDEIIGKADMIRYDKELFKNQKDQVLSHVKQNLMRDPYYFANNVNRQDLRQRVSDIMDSGVVQKAIDRKKLVDEHVKKMNDKQVQNTYVRDGDRRLQGMSKSEYANTLLSKSGEEVAQLLGATADNPWGNLYLDNRVGSIKDAHDALDKVAGLFKSSTNSGDTGWIDNMDFEGKQYIAKLREKGSVTSNLEAINAAKEYYASNWRRRFSPEEVHGFETNFENEFDKLRYEGPAVKVGDQELIGGDISAKEAHARALQLQPIAQQRGDQDMADQARNALIELEAKREQYIDTGVQNDIRVRLGLSAQHGVEKSTDQDLDMSATKDREENQDMGFNNALHNGAGHLDWVAGTDPSADDPNFVSPTQTTAIPAEQQAPYLNMINRKVLGEDGEEVIRPTSLAELGNKLVRIGGRWMPANKVLQSGNFKLTGGGTQAVRIHENEKEFQRSEQEIAQYKAQLDRTTDPTQRTLLAEIIDLERATQKQRTGIKFIVTADSNDFERNSAPGKPLSWKTKDGKTRGAVEADGWSVDQIVKEAPFRIYKDDGNAFAVDENWSLDHPYSMEIVLEEPNISYNDDNSINKKYNIPLGEEKKALQIAKNKLQTLKYMQRD